MLRNLCKLRKNIFMARIVYSKYAARSNIVTSSRQRVKTDESMVRGVLVTDINIHNIAREDPEFTRNFLTTLTSLQTESVIDLLSPTTADEAAKPEPEPSADADNSTVLDKDGQPVVPIEIDGWKNAEGDDEDGPTVQNPGDSIAIGDEDEYKKENLLIVPAKREGQVKYKGIKVKMPEKASLDIGTYRFRRNKEDFETVGDDMRLVKFDK